MHKNSDDFLVYDLDEDMYRLFLEQNEYEWSTSYQVGQCIHGCFSSVQYSIGKLLLFTALQRLVTVIDIPLYVKHASTVMLGLMVLRDWLPKSELVLPFLASLLGLVVLLSIGVYRHKGFIITAISIVSIILLQQTISSSDFLAIRGILMVLVMKISSLAFDFDASIHLLDLLAFAAYLLSPASLVFGPFHRFRDFQKAFQRRTYKEELLSFASGMLTLFLAFCMLIYSSCLTTFLSQASLFGDYFIAQSFRTSHYFVSFLSEGLMTLSGVHISVTSPLPVELPRSLVDVVVAWNLPMHRYLHSYVYAKFAHLGAAFSILASFAISSLLHGFNFQISAVLLSLGFICYFESKLRNRISKRFSMCVRARACKDCEHKMGSTSWQSIFVNIIFFAHSVYQLIYLGAPFDGEGASDGYDFQHTISVWRRHHFAAHWIGLIMALLSFCI